MPYVQAVIGATALLTLERRSGCAAGPPGGTVVSRPQSFPGRRAATAICRALHRDTERRCDTACVNRITLNSGVSGCKIQSV
jgi:hypothetical protein